MTYDFSVENLDILNSLQNHREGELAFVKENNQMYRWREETGWQPASKLTLYDLNKAIISQMKPLTKEQLTEKIKLIDDFDKKHHNNYYMFLCNERRYYTVCSHEIDCIDTLGDVIFELAYWLGDIYSVDEQEETSAIEIWIRPKEGKEVSMFLLFPYDKGVVNFS